MLVFLLRWQMCAYSPQACREEVERRRRSYLISQPTPLLPHIFVHEEEEAIVADNAHVVTGEVSQTDSEAKRAWDARAKLLKTVR
jgi:hypothetical protein